MTFGTRTRRGLLAEMAPARAFSRLAPERPPTLVLDILTLNSGLYSNLRSQERLERAATIGASLAPFDIVGLQGTVAQESELIQTIAQFTQPYQYCPTGTGFLASNYGLTLLSSYPIIKQDFLCFSKQGGQESLGKEGVSFTRLKLFRESCLDVYNIQLHDPQKKKDRSWLSTLRTCFSRPIPTDPPLRLAQYQELIVFIERYEASYPVVFLGNFRMDDETGESAWLVKQLKTISAGECLFFRSGKQAGLHIQVAERSRSKDTQRILLQPQTDYWGQRTRFLVLPA